MRAPTTAIANGFGITLGDGIVGLQALTLALGARVLGQPPVLLRLPGLSPVIQDLYRVAAPFAMVRRLPWAYAGKGTLQATASRFPTVIDLRDYAFDADFRGVAMIDFFLARLGLDPATIPSPDKRNTWLAPLVKPAPPPCDSGYVLVCPRASMPIRCMPPPIHDAITAWLRTRTQRAILSQDILPMQTTLAGLCGLVAAARLVISTDTAMVHLADAFSVPCLAFFPTHEPAWRVRDYPLCRAIHLPTRNLPPATEFSRGDRDVMAAHAAWFPDGMNLGWLETALEGMALT